MNEVDEKQDPTTGQEGEMPTTSTESINIGNLSALRSITTPLPKLFNDNPELQIPVYDPVEQKWFTLKLNRQRQLVVRMHLANGTPVENLLDPRSTRLLFDPQTLKSYEKPAAPIEKNRITIQDLVWGIEGHTDGKEEPPKDKIAESASKLVEILAEEERKLRIGIEGKDIWLIFHRKKDGNDNSELEQLKELVMKATGQTMMKHNETQCNTKTFCKNQGREKCQKTNVCPSGCTYRKYRKKL